MGPGGGVRGLKFRQWLVCAEATGKVWGVSLGNRSVTDKSMGGDCCMKCGNCKDKHCGEKREMGIQVKVKSKV